MSNLINFTFENLPVRIIDLNNNHWFIANDVCNILEIQNTTDALKALDDDEKTKLEVSPSFNLGVHKGVKAINIINESGLYALILRSRKAMQKGTIQHKFRKWVTSEVLPSIRKTGSYSVERQTINIEQQSAIRQAIAKRCKSDSVHYQTVYTAVQKHFDIPRYTELLASDFAEAMAFIDTIELVQSFPSQSFLTPSDLKTLGKVICYASMYAEFAQTVKKDKGQSAVGTYNATIGNDDDGFLMVFHPKFEKDIEQAQILFKRIAQHSLLPVG